MPHTTLPPATTVLPLVTSTLPYHTHIYIYTYTGWLNAYREGGWLPTWASPGYRNCMVGTFADVVVADAIVKNVPNFDLKLAVAALTKDVSTRYSVFVMSFLSLKTRKKYVD